MLKHQEQSFFLGGFQTSRLFWDLQLECERVIWSSMDENFAREPLCVYISDFGPHLAGLYLCLRFLMFVVKKRVDQLETILST